MSMCTLTKSTLFLCFKHNSGSSSLSNSFPLGQCRMPSQINVSDTHSITSFLLIVNYLLFSYYENILFPSHTRNEGKDAFLFDYSGIPCPKLLRLICKQAYFHNDSKLFLVDQEVSALVRRSFHAFLIGMDLFSRASADRLLKTVKQ